MASMQCYKPAATSEAVCPKTCQSKPANGSSLGQKVSEMAGFFKGVGHHGQHGGSHTTTTTTQCSATTTTVNGDGLAQHQQHQKHHATNGMSCYGGKTKKKGDHHKNKKAGGRNLLEKIKEGISGHSSGSDSSESDSKDKGCGRKKN